MSEAAGLQLAETATPAPEPVENEPHIDILRRDVNEWNRWRSVNPELKPQLEGVKCTHADLQKANLSNANLREADLSNSDLSGADLANADLTGASLGGTKFEGADLRDADFSGAELEWFLVEAANLRGANLQGIDFGKASVAGTNLHDTDLRNADLRLVTGLQANQLAGADLSAAKLPQGFDSTEGLSNVEESSKNPRKLFLLMLLVCAYTLLTAFTTTDAGLVTNSGTSPLPIIGARIPIVGFYWCSPVLLLGVYVYFHLYSQRLWEALAALPAVFPDRRTLDRAAYPWLLNGLICAHRRRLVDRRPALFGWQHAASVFAAWWVVPLTILGLWVRFLTRQDAAGTSWHVVLVLLSVTAAVISYRLAKATLSGVQPVPRGRLAKFARLAAAVYLVGYFGYFSRQATQGAYSGGVFTADFESQEVSTQLAGWSWTDDGSDLRMVQGVRLEERNLRHANAKDAFLARADLRGADLSGADLRGADLRGAEFNEKTGLYWADLRGADLFGAKGLNQNLLNQVRGDSETARRLPEGDFSAPSHWSNAVLEVAQFVPIPAGSFEMGCLTELDLECYPDEKPRHERSIAMNFLMQATEVTVAQYKHFAQETDREMPPAVFFNPGWTLQDHPIVEITWGDAKVFCEWAGGRLPTEAEWEYAARGGNKGLIFPWGKELTRDDANYAGTGGRDQYESTAPVASFPANDYELFDMAGNVWEWVADWYQGDYYSAHETKENPKGPSTGERRVMRSGAWSGLPEFLRTSNRFRYEPENSSNDIGFRCAREVSP